MARIREFLIEEKTRHGTARFLFHRRPDGRRITIKGSPGDPEFEERYDWLASGGDTQVDLQHEAVKRMRDHEAPHTVAELGLHFSRYMDEEVLRRTLSPVTAQHYGRFTDRFVEEFGAATLHSIQSHNLERILSRWSRTSNAYNNALRALKRMFSYAENQWGLKPNPSAALEKIKVVTTGFSAWEDDDLRAFFRCHKLGSKAYLTMMLLMHAAPRRADLVRIGPSNIITIGGVEHLKFVPQKTERHSAIPVTIPIQPQLREALDATDTGETTFLITNAGSPFTVTAPLLPR